MRAASSQGTGTSGRSLVIAHGARSPQPKHQTWLARGGADAAGSPFHELGLSEEERNAGGAIGRRNYSFLLSPTGQRPAEVDWTEVFTDPTKPLIVDMGCGAGRYVLLMGQRRGPTVNCLGIDIHAALLDRANGWAASRGLSGHVRYLQANAVVSTEALLASYPGSVELLSIQYPDPQQRRQRHMVGRQLVETLARVLPPGAKVLLNSDFEDTAAYMRNAFERFGSSHFEPAAEHATQPVFPCSPQLPPLAVPRRARAHEAGGARPQQQPGVSVGASSSGAAVGGQGGARQESVLGPQAGMPEAVEGRQADVEDEEEEADLLYFRGSWHAAGWLQHNPVGAPTEREVYIEAVTRGQVYRVLLVRR